MFLRSSLPGALCALALTCPALLAQDGPAVNVQNILRELDQIEAQQKASLQSTKQATMAKLKAASNSGQAAAALYVEAVEAVSFEGKKGKAGQFANWKDSASDAVRSKEMQTVLMMHLKYIVLSIERRMTDKPELFAPPSLAYAVELYNAEALFFKMGSKAESMQIERERGIKQSTQDQETMSNLKKVVELKKEFMDKSIADSVFTKWLRMGAWFPKGDDWEMVPGNISGILEKNVRPFLRKAKNPQVIDTWEFEMKVMADRATANGLDHQVTEFNTVTRPRLQLSRANEMAEIGQTNRAISEVYSMIKTYPQHPDFGKWVQRLRELIKTASPGAVSAPAESETPAPAEGTTPPTTTPPAGTSPQ